jgi:hypothetical protein
MWPEPELRAIIRPEPEMKNRSLHSANVNTFDPGRGLIFMATCVHSERLANNQQTTSQHIKIHKINNKILGQSEPVSKK